MIENATLLTQVINPFLETLLQNKKADWDLQILEARQSAARPLNTDGSNKNYVYYRVLPETELGLETSTETTDSSGNMTQNTEAIRELVVCIDCLGTRASDIHNYILHAFNSNLYPAATVYPNLNLKLYFNGVENARDLTELENNKFLSRVYFELYFTYESIETFSQDYFTGLEINQKVVEGRNVVTQTLIIPK